MPSLAADRHAAAAEADSFSLRRRRGSMSSSSTSTSSSSSSLARTVLALSAATMMVMVEARPLGFYSWRSQAHQDVTQNSTTLDPAPTKRTHHLPGSAMSVLVDAWLDVQELQSNLTTTKTATPQASPTIHHHPSPNHHQQHHQSSASTSPSSFATTALLDWHECSSNFPVPRIEILSRHAHDNTITFSIEQSSSSRQQQACHNHHYHHHSDGDDDSRSTMNTVTPSASPPSSMRWLATQFQNNRGNWICATQETAACRKRFIYTASCPTTQHAQEASWARVALYLADDSLALHRQDENAADTCTAIRNSVVSSRDKKQHQRQSSGSQTCAFHFQLPCQPITATAASAPVTESSASSSWTSSSSTMSAI